MSRYNIPVLRDWRIFGENNLFCRSRSRPTTFLAARSYDRELGVICNANTLMSSPSFPPSVLAEEGGSLDPGTRGVDRNVVPVFSERLKKFKSNANEAEELNISGGGGGAHERAREARKRERGQRMRERLHSPPARPLAAHLWLAG